MCLSYYQQSGNESSENFSTSLSIYLQIDMQDSILSVEICHLRPFKYYVTLQGGFVTRGKSIQQKCHLKKTNLPVFEWRKQNVGTILKIIIFSLFINFSWQLHTSKKYSIKKEEQKFLFSGTGLVTVHYHSMEELIVWEATQKSGIAVKRFVQLVSHF